jgi:hypothetical protein
MLRVIFDYLTLKVASSRSVQLSDALGASANRSG